MLSLVTRVRHQELYERLKKTAIDTCFCSTNDIKFLSEQDDGEPRIAETYNRLGTQSEGDIIVFCHDDVTFWEPGWDWKLSEYFKEHNEVDVCGPIGVDRYDGGALFTIGYPHCIGKYVNDIDGHKYVKVFSKNHEFKPLIAVDGMFMAVRAEHFKTVKFDEKLAGLFFYDIDYCLRSRVGLIDLLIGHYKNEETYGNYPEGMTQQAHFEPYFYAKHKLFPRGNIGDMRCAAVSLEDYHYHGQDKIHADFRERFAIA